MLNDLATGTGSPEGSLEDGVRGGEAEWRAVMADFESWDGTQVSFCKARGISRKSFQAWRRRLGLTAGSAAGGFVELAAAGPGWDVELSLGGGVVLRLRRS